MLDRPREFVRKIDTRINQRLDAVAALPPPPVFLTVERAISMSVPMQSSVLTSVIFHLFLILAIGGKFFDPSKFVPPHNMLDVVLVNAKSSAKPIKADALAQANLDGGGNTDEKRRAKNPLPSQNDETTQLEEAQARLSRTAREAATLATKVITATRTDTSTQTPSSVELREESSPNLVPNTLANRVLQRVWQISRLEAEISRDWSAYQQRPKRKFVGARAAEYRFAGYVEDWRTRIEKIGNENYPEAARKNNIYGSLLISVAIRADGNLDSVEILRSSGSKILDAAAIHIVELAAPFGPFPLDLRGDTDVLHITRTWTFTKANELVSE